MPKYYMVGIMSVLQQYSALLMGFLRAMEWDSVFLNLALC